MPKGARLVGNLPYYVSSPLMRRFLALRDHVSDIHVMLQEEVARRIASPPGSREYGILSVLYGLTSEVVLAAHFPAACFAPPPKVELGAAPGSISRDAAGRSERSGGLRNVPPEGVFQAPKNP